MAKRQALSPLCHPNSPEQNKIIAQKPRHQGSNPMFQSANFNYYANYKATDPFPNVTLPTLKHNTNIKQTLFQFK